MLLRDRYNGSKGNNMRYVFLLVILVFSISTIAKPVIIIHSYHVDFPWVQQYRAGFFQQISTTDILEYEMDTKRQPSEKFTAIAKGAWQFIKQNKPAVVVLADDNALRMLGPKLIRHNIPLVFLGINENPRRYISLLGDVSGVLERPLLKRSVAMLKKIDPSYIKIKVLMDKSYTSLAILETSLNNRRSQRILGIEVDTKIVDSAQQWRQEVLKSKVEGYQAVIVAVYAAITDSSGVTVSTDSLSEWSSKYSPVPLFAFWSFSVAKGKAIGGLTISGKDQGSEAAKKVNHYISYGEFTKVVTGKRGTFLFSKHELKRWDIKLSAAIRQQEKFVD